MLNQLDQAKEKWGRLRVCLWDDCQFTESKAEWDQLHKKSGSDRLFLSWDWLAAWWKYFGKNDDLQLKLMVVKTHESKIVAIAPFCSRRTFVRKIPTERMETPQDSNLASFRATVSRSRSHLAAAHLRFASATRAVVIPLVSKWEGADDGGATQDS